MKSVGKPDAGNPHVRFDERGRETGRCRMAQATAPFLDSTILSHYGSFPIIAPNADRFVELVESHGDHVRVVVPKVGEAFSP